MQRGVLLAVVLAVPVGRDPARGRPVLCCAHQPAEVVPLAADYTVRLAPGVLPFFLFIVLRQTLQRSIGSPRPIVLAIVLANLVNAALNWVLIFGHRAPPRWACPAPPGPPRSAAGCWRGLLFALAWRALARWCCPSAGDLAVGRRWRRMLRLGLPIGAQSFSSSAPSRWWR